MLNGLFETKCSLRLSFYSNVPAAVECYLGYFMNNKQKKHFKTCHNFFKTLMGTIIITDIKNARKGAQWMGNLWRNLN